MNSDITLYNQNQEDGAREICEQLSTILYQLLPDLFLIFYHLTLLHFHEIFYKPQQLIHHNLNLS